MQVMKIWVGRKTYKVLSCLGNRNEFINKIYDTSRYSYHMGKNETPKYSQLNRFPSNNLKEK